MPGFARSRAQGWLNVLFGLLRAAMQDAATRHVTRARQSASGKAYPQVAEVMSHTPMSATPKRRWSDAAMLAGLTLLMLGPLAIVGLGLVREVPAPGALVQTARGGILCPSSPPLVDSERLQQQIDADMVGLAARLPALAPEAAKAELERLQIETWQFVLQNPRRGMAWVQLLAATPQATREYALFSQLFQKSFDLSRLMVDAARGRLFLAAPRWTRLAPLERQMVLADARTLASAKIAGFTHPLQLVQIGIAGGPELRAQIRKIIQETWPEALAYYDWEERRILENWPKS